MTKAPRTGDFCFGLPGDPAEIQQKLDLFRSADAHLMDRVTYQAMAGALPTADHPFTPTMNAARKVVFSRTLQTAEWANTTIAAGDTAEEIDSSGKAATATSWAGAASASGGRSCRPT